MDTDISTMLDITPISIDDFLSFKSANRDMLPELVEYIKLQQPKPKQWRKPEYKKLPYKQFNGNNAHTNPHGGVSRQPNSWLTNMKNSRSDDDKLYSNIRSILNKISDSNLDELYNDITTLKLTNKEHVEKLVDLIFIKAVSENKFTHLYAKLSKLLFHYTIELDPYLDPDQEVEMDNIPIKIAFKTLLVNKCQSVFNYCITIDKNLEDDDVDVVDDVVDVHVNDDVGLKSND